MLYYISEGGRKVKVLLYFESEKMLAKSGIGRALDHQKRALTEVGISYTLDEKEDYDILHINTYGINSHNMVNKARREGKKVVYHAHSTEEDFRNSFIGSNQLSPIVKKYRPDPMKEQKFREYFKLSPDQKVIICVGLFFERKGIIDFVEIAKKMPEYTFIWFGHVPMYSIPRNIRKIVKEDHPENVLFPGYIRGEIIEGAYSGADLFFFPSYEETEGIVVLEALASKQNVLVRDIPVYNGWLEDSKNCYMGKTNEEFIRLIQQITNQELPSTTQAGYQTAKERSINKIGEELKNVYERKSL